MKDRNFHTFVLLPSTISLLFLHCYCANAPTAEPFVGSSQMTGASFATDSMQAMETMEEADIPIDTTIQENTGVVERPSTPKLAAVTQPNKETARRRKDSTVPRVILHMEEEKPSIQDPLAEEKWLSHHENLNQNNEMQDNTEAQQASVGIHGFMKQHFHLLALLIILSVGGYFTYQIHSKRSHSGSNTP